MKKYFTLLSVIVYLSASLLLSSSCKKKTITEIIHIDTIVTGNQPPNYTGVATINIQLYVNKLYVDLLGREATDAELNTNVNNLIINNLSAASREAIIQNLFTDSLFYGRIFSITTSDFINGTGEFQIQDEINFLQYQSYIDSVNGGNNHVYYYAEINRLHDVQSATNLLQAGSISMNEYYERFMNNYFYDQVNMGTENFVKGAFDDLFRRSPTTSELESSATMVDGQPSFLFTSDGGNKGDFMNIVTTCDEFYEGYVRKEYLQFLLREPESQEMAAGVMLIKPTGDYKKLQLELLKSTEYAGF